MATVGVGGVFWQRTVADIDGTPANEVMMIPEGVWDLTVAVLGSGGATGSVEVTYSSAEQVRAATATWSAFPQTFTVADGMVAQPLAQSGGAPVTPTALRFNRTAGTLVGILTGKRPP
jgi:hypothetical protein